MSGVEREPLTITLPHGATETTVYLVSAYCEPHATRATEQEARQLCETAERANLQAGAEFAWHPTDDTELTHELYVVLGDEFRTEYTVTPIRIRQEQPPPAPADTPLTNAQRYGHACATYPWCKITCQHAAVHVALVALPHDAAVSIRAFGGPAEVTVTAYEPGTFIPAGIPPTVLTPAAARTLGQALVARGRDHELGQALIAAADLIEAAE